MNVRDRAADGRTALMCCALVADERWGVGLARTLLERGALVGLRTYQLRLNALHFACMLGRAQLVRTFLAALDFDLTDVDALGNTPLHYAAAVGRSDIIRLITDVDSRCTCTSTLSHDTYRFVTYIITFYQLRRRLYITLFFPSFFPFIFLSLFSLVKYHLAN